MSADVDKAQKKFERSDRNYRIAKHLLILYLVLITTFVAYQTYDVRGRQAEQLKTAQDALKAAEGSLQKSLDDNEVQHARTQEYIRCIATAILVPVAQRSDSIFDKCGIETNAPPRVTPQSTYNSAPPTINTKPSTPQSSVPNPTASGPPDPNSSPNPTIPERNSRVMPLTSLIQMQLNILSEGK